MQRLLLTLRYDGTAYHGWQVQPNGATVQERLQDAIEAVTGVRSGVIGCSRTDAGVHADGFCCTFDTESNLRGEKMIGALNAHLADDIAVYRCEEVTADFHPRYQSRGKRYVYRVWNAPYRNPFWERYAVHQRRVLDENALQQAAQRFVGTHDFAAFCAAGSSVTDTVRTVSDFSVERDGNMVIFSVSANGFLYNMVRIMVGTLLDIAFGKRTPESITQALAEKQREIAGSTAPAKGLCLKEVYYD